jgi:hypothetical protein
MKIILIKFFLINKLINYDFLNKISLDINFILLSIIKNQITLNFNKN